MKSSLVKCAVLLLCLSLADSLPLSAKKKPSTSDAASIEQKRAVHALNRLAFGPRPSDVQQVTAMGVDHWIDLQLHPEKIADGGLEPRLAAFRTLHMSSKEMVDEFPDQRVIREVMDGKKSMPSEPARRAVFQVQIARMQEKKEKKGAAKLAPASSQPTIETAKNAQEPAMSADGAGDATSTAKTEEELAAAANAETNGNAANSMTPAADVPSNSETKVSDDAEAVRREERLYTDLAVQGLVDLPPDQRFKKVMAMSAEEQLAFADSLRGGRGQEFLSGLDSKQKETLLAMNNPQGVIADELIQAKLLRAIYSERQLEEVMTDFWFNHFNVFLNKGADRVLLTDYEQNVIRPRAMGKFEDLLVATAKSPAMLFYLDNWLSVGPNSMQALGVPAHPGFRGPRRFPRQNPNANEKRRRSGLNENYGRELLELHTLSVNGGYSQRDVTEVAKVFTGWTIEKPFEGGGFRFDSRVHEPGPKFVLGKKIKPNGEGEGREVLHRLATSPQTAHFISLKLAQRFVSDDPPLALVDRMSKTFERKKGDIREVLSTLFHSQEFWAEGAYRAKVKTPLEFVVSAVRASGADVGDAMPLARQLGNMGMPLYGAQPPTGYSMKSETWVSSAALLNRMNFALALTGGKVRGVKIDARQLADSSLSSDPDLLLSTMETKLLTSGVSRQTHDSIIAQLETPKTESSQDADQDRKIADKTRPPDANTVAGLLLGSPEFQRR